MEAASALQIKGLLVEALLQLNFEKRTVVLSRKDGYTEIGHRAWNSSEIVFSLSRTKFPTISTDFN